MLNNKFLKKLSLLFLFAVILNFICFLAPFKAAATDETIILATTYSVYDTGLLVF